MRLNKQEAIPIELKYKTRELKDKNRLIFNRFGETLSINKNLKNQAAQNLGRYTFWKDVKRLEVIKAKFERVSAGFAVFLTNEESYLKEPKNDVNYEFFSMEDKKSHSSKKYWKNDAALKEKNPNFDLEATYQTDWHNKEINGERFFYVILQV